MNGIALLQVHGDNDLNANSLATIVERLNRLETDVEYLKKENIAQKEEISAQKEEIQKLQESNTKKDDDMMSLMGFFTLLYLLYLNLRISIIEKC